MVPALLFLNPTYNFSIRWLLYVILSHVLLKSTFIKSLHHSCFPEKIFSDDPVARCDEEDCDGVVKPGNAAFLLVGQQFSILYYRGFSLFLLEENN